MDIIIPLGGKGERFLKQGYDVIKPMIKVCGKPILYYLLDNLFYNYDSELSADINIYLVLGKEMNEYLYDIRQRYPEINILNIKTPTRGAAETIYLGLKQLNTEDNSRSLLLLDGDTFYKNDIVNAFENIKNNALATFKVDKTDPPHYSYCELNEHNLVNRIVEKNPISEWANTGAYYFAKRSVFIRGCESILDLDKKDKGEYYTSVVISELLNTGETFEIIKMEKDNVVFLGTPDQVKNFENCNYCYLFDLDGTLVTTDHLYVEVWKEILLEYGLYLTDDMFLQHIGGKNDLDAMKSLMLPVDDPTVISKKKDNIMQRHIKDVIIHGGVNNFIKSLRKKGYCIAVVTNSNRLTANRIIKQCNIQCDLLVSASDVKYPKPNPEPYLKAMKHFNISNDKTIIFEDSKSGILSALAVSPACVVGISSIQNEEMLYRQGCNIVISNSFEDCLNKKITEYVSYNKNQSIVNKLRDLIFKSLNKEYDLKDVIIEMTKMKGGYIADVLKVNLVLENDNIKECVFKLESTHQNMLSETAIDLDLYNREYYFYESIVKYAPINAPKYIATIKDENFKTIGILLESINIKYYDINVNLKNKSVDTIMKIIDRCSEFHAWSWNKDIKSSFPYIKFHNDEIFYPKWFDFINNRWDIFKNKWQRILTSEQTKLAEKVCKSYDKIQKAMSTGNICICHGDVKSPNIFMHKETSEPIFIDWQYLVIGKGVADIIFLMIESLDFDSRNKWWDFLLNYYYIKLSEHGVKNYDVNDFEKDILISMCHFPFFVALWFGTVDTDDLIDKNFPFIFIRNYFTLLELKRDEINNLLDILE